MFCSFSPLQIFLFSSPLHLYRQQLGGSLDCIVPSALSARLTVANGLSFQRWSTAIKDENRLDADKKKFAYSAEEANDVAVAQRISFLVTNSFEELVNPDGSIDSE